MWETLLGGVFGGLLRLAPEVLKWLDRKDERNHELRLLSAEMDFAKLRAETEMHKTEAGLQGAELSTMAEAFKEQAMTAKEAGWFVSATSALVRPLVTYVFVGLYGAVKVATYLIAVSQGGAWQEVIVQMWQIEDMAVFNMILSFWFVGRVYERSLR